MSGISTNRTNITLPSEVSQEIMQKMQSESAIMRLARKVALPGRGLSISVITLYLIYFPNSSDIATPTFGWPCRATPRVLLYYRSSSNLDPGNIPPCHNTHRANRKNYGWR